MLDKVESIYETLDYRPNDVLKFDKNISIDKTGKLA